MPDVRTTLEPDRVLTVDDREAYALRQQNLLVEDDVDKAPTDDPAAPQGAHPDADEARDERNQARREELGDDKGKGRSKTQAKTE